MNDQSKIEHDMEGPIPQLQLDTMSGDLRDAMLSRIRHMKTSWSLCNEEEQAEIANGLELAAKSFVREAVRQLVGWDIPRAVVKLGEVKIKGEKGIEAKIEAQNIAEYRDVLGEHVGSYVMIVMADSDNFMGERAPAEVEPDQGDWLRNPAQEEELDDDEILARAIRVVVNDKKCSTSWIQRKLSIGYNKAARLIERMEEVGIVSKPNEVGKRDVLADDVNEALEAAGLTVAAGMTALPKSGYDVQSPENDRPDPEDLE